jgi:hypothetical protein
MPAPFSLGLDADRLARRVFFRFGVSFKDDGADTASRGKESEPENWKNFPQARRKTRERFWPVEIF